MKIFGHKHDPNCSVGKNYRRVPTRPVTLIHDPVDETELIIFGCQLCRDGFIHWLCADKEWKKLHPCLHKKVICFNCYHASRKLISMLKEQ